MTIESLIGLKETVEKLIEEAEDKEYEAEYTSEMYDIGYAEGALRSLRSVLEKIQEAFKTSLLTVAYIDEQIAETDTFDELARDSEFVKGRLWQLQELKNWIEDHTKAAKRRTLAGQRLAIIEALSEYFVFGITATDRRQFNIGGVEFHLLDHSQDQRQLLRGVTEAAIQSRDRVYFSAVQKKKFVVNEYFDVNDSEVLHRDVVVDQLDKPFGCDFDERSSRLDLRFGGEPFSFGDWRISCYYKNGQVITKMWNLFPE